MTVFAEHSQADGGIEATFCFVDLAGFTALTEAHGDEEAADLAVRFAGLVKESLGPNDRLMKTVGDGVLVMSPGPGQALSFIQRLCEKASREHDFLRMRAGLHHGAGTQRSGEVFGASVNLAARVASQACGGQVLATESILEAARMAGVTSKSLGQFDLHNVRDPVELFSLDLSEPLAGTAVDPVCRMRIDKNAAAQRMRVDQTDYWFCSTRCATAFAQDPDAYIKMLEKETRK